MGRPDERKFKDSNEEEWTITINVGTARRVRDECDVDILEATRGRFDSLQKITNDEYTLGAVLWSLCQDQAKERGLDEKQFAERFADADVIENAVNALLFALISFFPRRSRPTLETLLQKMHRKLEAKRTVELETADRLATSPEMDRQLDELIASAFSTSVTSSPASSESSPTP